MKQIALSILFIFPALVTADESCFYSSKNDGGLFSHFEDCGSIIGDDTILKESHLNNLVFDSDGLSCLMFSAKDVFYVLKNGHTQRVHYFDNGCDYFEEGLARGIIDGKMVYINKHLETVLSPNFELLLHFDYGHAVVCNGPFIEEKHGEHTLLKGGRCGLIDKQGELVVEAEYKIGDRKIFQDYINSNNHCPRPPVLSETAALCHAKRHVSNMDYHSGKWNRHSISNLGEVWIISFVEEGSAKEEFTLTLNAGNAQWISLIKEPHKKALQRD